MAQTTQTFQSVHHFFEVHTIPPATGDYDTDMFEAIDMMVSISEECFEEFDIHDLIDYVATHYGVEPSILLEEYDNYQISIQYCR